MNNILPQKSWDDITLEDYIELNNIQKNNNTIFSVALETIIYLTDDDSFEDSPMETILDIYKKNQWLKTIPKYKEKTDKFILKKFNKITLGEWIDLDYSVTDNDIESIITILYKQYEKDKWNNIIYEPYIYSLEERKELFKNISINDIYIIEEFKKYRLNVLENYNGLFSGIEENLQDDEKTGLDLEEIKEINKIIQEENIKKDFAWQKLIDELSGGNWSYSESILNLPILYVFNMLNMKKVYNH